MSACLHHAPAVGQAEVRVRVADVEEQNHGFEFIFQRHVAADDAFQVAVFGAQQQRAVVVQGFGAAADLAVADVDGDIAGRWWCSAPPIRRPPPRTAPA